MKAKSFGAKFKKGEYVAGPPRLYLRPTGSSEVSC